MGHRRSQRRAYTVSFVLRVYLFCAGRNFREVSIRIFICFSGVSFNKLMHQNECIVGFVIIHWSASPLSWIYLALIVFFVIYSPDFIHSRVWLTLMAIIGFPLPISLTRVIEATRSLVEEESSVNHLFLSAFG